MRVSLSLLPVHTLGTTGIPRLVWGPVGRGFRGLSGAAWRERSPLQKGSPFSARVSLTLQAMCDGARDKSTLPLPPVSSPPLV